MARWNFISSMVCAFPFLISQLRCNYLSFFCQSFPHSVLECWFYIVVTVQWACSSHPVWAFIDYIRLLSACIPPPPGVPKIVLSPQSDSLLGFESLFLTIVMSPSFCPGLWHCMLGSPLFSHLRPVQNLTPYARLPQVDIFIVIFEF